jgi:hypothetical protein
MQIKPGASVLQALSRLAEAPRPVAFAERLAELSKPAASAAPVPGATAAAPTIAAEPAAALRRPDGGMVKPRGSLVDIVV